MRIAKIGPTIRTLRHLLALSWRVDRTATAVTWLLTVLISVTPSSVDSRSAGPSTTRAAPTRAPDGRG